MTSSVSNSIDSISTLEHFNKKWSPYLKKEHKKELKECTKFIAKVIKDTNHCIGKEDKLKNSFARIEVFKKRVEKRKVEIQFIANFIKECDSLQDELQKHLFGLNEMLKNCNDAMQEKKAQAIVQCTNNYFAFVSALKAMALQIQRLFEEKKFDAGFRKTYPKMLQDLFILLKKADLFQEVKNIPDVVMTKGDILKLLQDENSNIQALKKLTSLDWITFLKWISHEAGIKIFLPEELREEEEKKKNQYLELLSSYIAYCEKSIAGHQEQKQVCEQILEVFNSADKPEELRNKERAILNHIQLFLDYYAVLKELLLQTKDCISKGRQALKVAYPEMVKKLGLFLQTSDLKQEAAKMSELPKTLNKDILAIWNDKEVDLDNYQMEDWIVGMMLLVKLADQAFDNISPKEEEAIEENSNNNNLQSASIDSNNNQPSDVELLLDSFQKFEKQSTKYLTSDQLSQLKSYIAILIKANESGFGKTINKQTTQQMLLWFATCNQEINERQSEFEIILRSVSEFEATFKSLENHLKQIKEQIHECKDNKLLSQLKQKQKNIQEFTDFSKVLYTLAQMALKAFNEKRFSAQLKVDYPLLLNQLVILLKQANMLREIEQIPDSKIQGDMQLILQNNSNAVKAPEHFCSKDWMGIIRILFEKGAYKFLSSPGKSEKFESTLTDVNQQLDLWIAACDIFIDQCTALQKEYAKLTDVSESESSHGQDSRLTFLNVSINFFVGLKNLMQQTNTAFLESGSEGVQKVYPQLVYVLKELLKKSSLSEVVEGMPDHWIKEALKKAQNDQAIDIKCFSIDEWSVALFGFLTQGMQALSKRAQESQLDDVFLADRVNELFINDSNNNRKK